ncbi:MAG: SEL1-like repeat protein [Parachlamydiaceae bacterium]|nr:SEL1-like repeat protein [Parachlamydiaceae bacterium]
MSSFNVSVGDQVPMIPQNLPEQESSSVHEKAITNLEREIATLERAIAKDIPKELYRADGHVHIGTLMSLTSWVAGFMLGFALAAGSLGTLGIPIVAIASCSMLLLLVDFAINAKHSGVKEAAKESAILFGACVVIPFVGGALAGAASGAAHASVGEAKVGYGILAFFAVGIPGLVGLVAPGYALDRGDTQNQRVKDTQKLFKDAQKELAFVHQFKNSFEQIEQNEQVEAQSALIELSTGVERSSKVESSSKEVASLDDEPEFWEFESNSLEKLGSIDKKKFSQFSSVGETAAETDKDATSMRLPQRYSNRSFELMKQFMDAGNTTEACQQIWERAYSLNPLSMQELLEVAELANFYDVKALRESCNILLEARLLQKPNECITFLIDTPQSKYMNETILSLFNKNFFDSNLRYKLSKEIRGKLISFLENKEPNVYKHSLALMQVFEYWNKRTGNRSNWIDPKIANMGLKGTQLLEELFAKKYLPGQTDFMKIVPLFERSLYNNSDPDAVYAYLRTQHTMRNYQADFSDLAATFVDAAISSNDINAKFRAVALLDGDARLRERYPNALALLHQECVINGKWQKVQNVRAAPEVSVPYYNAVRRLALAGNPEAQRRLSNCYEFGDGVEKDNLQAYLWAKKAAVNGDLFAAESIPGIVKNAMGIIENE